MAKRFTDTGKWKKGLLRSLPPYVKLLWLYIIDECDHAGIWNVEWEVMELRLGIKIDRDETINFLAEKIQVFDGGQKWFIPDFISFQYGVLNPTNRVHKSILELLSKYKNKGLASPLQGAKDKDLIQGKGYNEGGVGETSDEDYWQNIIFFINMIYERSDPYFEQMLYNAKLDEALINQDNRTKYMALLSEYPKKRPDDQQKLRNSFLGFLTEQKTNKSNGNHSKTGSSKIISPNKFSSTVH